MKERRGCPNCAKALALINQHLSGRVYDDLDDALRNLLQAFVTMRENYRHPICEAIGCEEYAALKRMRKP